MAAALSTKGRRRRRPPPLFKAAVKAALLVVSLTNLCDETAAYTPIFTEEMLSRRTISRFIIGHEDNSVCWNRSVTEDSFISPIDGHNHFR